MGTETHACLIGSNQVDHAAFAATGGAWLGSESAGSHAYRRSRAAGDGRPPNGEGVERPTRTTATYGPTACARFRRPPDRGGWTARREPPVHGRRTRACSSRGACGTAASGRRSGPRPSGSGPAPPGRWPPRRSRGGRGGGPGTSPNPAGRANALGGPHDEGPPGHRCHRTPGEPVHASRTTAVPTLERAARLPAGRRARCRPGTDADSSEEEAGARGAR